MFCTTCTSSSPADLPPKPLSSLLWNHHPPYCFIHTNTGEKKNWNIHRNKQCFHVVQGRNVSLWICCDLFFFFWHYLLSQTVNRALRSFLAFSFSHSHLLLSLFPCNSLLLWIFGTIYSLSYPQFHYFYRSLFYLLSIFTLLSLSPQTYFRSSSKTPSLLLSPRLHASVCKRAEQKNEGTNYETQECIPYLV